VADNGHSIGGRSIGGYFSGGGVSVRVVYCSHGLCYNGVENACARNIYRGFPITCSGETVLSGRSVYRRRIRKTFTLSPRVISVLEELAKHHALPYSLVVEYAIDEMSRRRRVPTSEVVGSLMSGSVPAADFELDLN